MQFAPFFRMRPWDWVGSVLLFAIFILVSFFPGKSCIADTSISKANLHSKAMHSERAGIYYRVSKRDRGLNYDHPLIDAVIVGASWADLEPKQGVFNFDALLETVSIWGKAGKGVVINTPLYGQNPKKSMTPDWVYETGVQKISFSGGGRAKGRQISVPVVWDESFVEQYMAPFVSALADTLSGNPYVWYVMPAFGHIGNLNAQPSKGGAEAFKQSGWTPEKWTKYANRVLDLYQDKFQTIPLLVKSAPMLLRDRQSKHYAQEADRLLASAAKQGAAVLSLGLSADTDDIDRVKDRLAPLIDLALSGHTRLGVGDDWPLWVPKERRRHGPTQGRDERAFAESFTRITGKVGGLPATILFCQEPEISASNPNHFNHRREVEVIMRNIRQRLLEIDSTIVLGTYQD